MGSRAVLLGLALAATVAACGGDSYDPGEEVWIDLKGDRAVHQGYALAIVINQREELVEIQVNSLSGGEGDEYLPVLRKGRAFVPVRIVQSRREGLLDIRRKRETISDYRKILAHDVTHPRAVSDKARERARRYGMKDVVLVFDLQSIVNDAILGEDDKVDLDNARRTAADVLRKIRKRLDEATGEMSDRQVLSAVTAAEGAPPAERASHANAPLVHGVRLARQTLAQALTARGGLTSITLTAASDLTAAIDAYVEFAWRYDPHVRAAARRLKVTSVAEAKARMRRYHYRDLLERLRDQIVTRAASDLTPPVSDAQVEARFAAARREMAEISARLKVEVIPVTARDVFAVAIRAAARKQAKEARAIYIRGNADRLVLAGKWSGRTTCPAGSDPKTFPVALDLRLDLDLTGEGLGIYRGAIAARTVPAADADRWALLHRVLPIDALPGALPGEGIARGVVRVRVDTETGALRWIQILSWSSGPPLLRRRIEDAGGRLDWRRPVRFFVDLCGRHLEMMRPPDAAPNR